MLNNTKTQSRPKLLFLVPAISQTHKSLENSQDFFFKTKTKTKTKTLFFVLEAPRDQDSGLEDYITVCNLYTRVCIIICTTVYNYLTVCRVLHLHLCTTSLCYCLCPVGEQFVLTTRTVYCSSTLTTVGRCYFPLAAAYLLPDNAVSESLQTFQHNVITFFNSATFFVLAPQWTSQ